MGLVVYLSFDAGYALSMVNLVACAIYPVHDVAMWGSFSTTTTEKSLK